MATSSFTPVRPPTRQKGRSIRGLLVTAILGIVVAVVIVSLAQHPREVGQAYGKLAAAASPVMAGTSRVDLSLAATPTPTPGPVIKTTRTRVALPAGEIKDIQISLKSGDQLVGIFESTDPVDFSFWALSDPRQRLLQQVQTQGQSKFAWTADQDGNYAFEFLSPQATTVSIAYAVRSTQK